MAELKQKKKVGIIEALKSGDIKTLIASLLYFDTGFMVWLLFGPALGLFIAQELGLSPAEKGFMVAVPILAAALFRIPFGYMYQAINGKYVAMMGIILSALPILFVNLFPINYTTLLILGAFLGIGGASFAIALPMAGSNYPKKYQGLVLGLAAAGNLGAMMDGLIFPPIAETYGWRTAALVALVFLAISFVLCWAWIKDSSPKRPELRNHAIFNFIVTFVSFIVVTLMLYSGILGISGKFGLLLLPVIVGAISIMLLSKDYRNALKKRDPWVFMLFYAITFGGFVGMSGSVAFILNGQYGFDPVTCGMLMSLLSFSGAIIRPVGGWIADKIGGVKVLLAVFAAIATFDYLLGFTIPPAIIGIPLLWGLFLSFGIGNGAVFQLVPLRWPRATGMATGLIGAAGGVGGFYLSSTMGLAKEFTGSYGPGYLIFGTIALIALGVLWMLKHEYMQWGYVGHEEDDRPISQVATSEIPVLQFKKQNP
ncbi:major facilitator superfamily MFS_1 [Methanocaldococcus sp. FS406-22]|uniref:nitrate/nitrite transporter n=1 Tax=Methanocaldococcus sp. (strain FS406-22) TaxID=644281 RepID=UPI0001BF4370|nr:nitrate/nitrite transporter [Methanocaldococcus sp. FS406-22]ADC70086.1 major facilitator superfamily MFS_1 [Methanocaldococcus sp. FS406-22]